MTALQPDLFGAVSIVGASRTVKALEAEQCLGQTDVYSQLADVAPCVECGADDAPLSRNDLCPACVRAWIRR